MTIKIVGGEQIVCDCTGNTPLTYQERLLAGIIVRKDTVTLEVHCPVCEHCKHFVISNKLALSWTNALDVLKGEMKNGSYEKETTSREESPKSKR